MRASIRLALVAALAAIIAAGAYWLTTRGAAPATPLDGRPPPPTTAPTATAVEDSKPSPTMPAESGTSEPDIVGRPLSHVALLSFSAAPGSAPPVAFVSVKPRHRPVPRRPDMPFAAGRLEVAIEDREGNRLWRTVIADPRLVRGEFFDGDGRIEESVQVLRDGAARIVFPHDDAAHRLVVLEPVAADGFAPRQIASLELP